MEMRKSTKFQPQPNFLCPSVENTSSARILLSSFGSPAHSFSLAFALPSKPPPPLTPCPSLNAFISVRED